MRDYDNDDNYEPDEDLLDYDGYALGEDEWEDHPAAKRLKDEMPAGWHMVKVVNFTAISMQQIEDWLKANARSSYKIVGFRSYCAYNNAIQFADIVDAMMFKLRWR